MYSYLEMITKAVKNDNLVAKQSLLDQKNQGNILQSELEASHKTIESKIKPDTKASFIRSEISLIEEIKSAGQKQIPSLVDKVTLLEDGKAENEWVKGEFVYQRGVYFYSEPIVVEGNIYRLMYNPNNVYGAWDTHITFSLLRIALPERVLENDGPTTSYYRIIHP